MLSPFTPATVRGQIQLPLRFDDGYVARARVLSFEGLYDGREHVALALGDRAEEGTTETAVAPLVRLHSECLTGDVSTPTPCRMRDWTPTRRTWPSVSQRTSVTTPSRHRCCWHWGWTSSTCSPTTPTRRRSCRPRGSGSTVACRPGCTCRPSTADTLRRKRGGDTTFWASHTDHREGRLVPCPIRYPPSAPGLTRRSCRPPGGSRRTTRGPLRDTKARAVRLRSVGTRTG